MKRYEILDGFRGYFLVFMTLNHIIFQEGNPISWANHNRLGYVEDAQGFIFISGFIVGIYYTSMHIKGRRTEMRDRIQGRARELYYYSLGILVAIALLVAVLPAAREAWEPLLGRAFADGPSRAAAVLLLYQPSFMDILPQYILYLLVSPVLIRLTVEGRWTTVAAGSLGLWAAVQFGSHLPLVALGDAALGSLSPELALRGFFSPLAWQLVFVAGLLAGAGIATGRLDTHRWLGPQRTDLAQVALAIVAFFAVWRIGFELGIMRDDMAEQFHRLHDRTLFSPVFLVNFAATGYLVAWLLNGGRQAADPAVRAIGEALARLFTLPFLRFIGSHSLQVYAYHVILVYLVAYADARWGAFGEAEKVAISVAAVASLWIPAALHARGPARPKLRSAGQTGAMR